MILGAQRCLTALYIEIKSRRAAGTRTSHVADVKHDFVSMVLAVQCCFAVLYV